jgi:hypothetical protein
VRFSLHTSGHFQPAQLIRLHTALLYLPKRN